MATEVNVKNLIINKVENATVFNYMKSNGLVNEDELYIIENCGCATVSTAGTSILLEDNTEYRLADVSSLTLSYPEGNFEVWMRLEFSETETINVVFPTETRFIGTEPVFENGQTWEISIKDDVAICWRVA